MTSRATHFRRIAATAAAVALLVPGQAAGSTTQETIIQDDPALLTPSLTKRDIEQTMIRFRTLGVDRVRVSLYWRLVAPKPFSQTKPRFASPGAGWPGAYPRGSWNRYDTIVKAANEYGVRILLSVTGPAPAWATPIKRGREGFTRPDVSEYRDFVRAAAIRYSGAYPLSSEAPAPPRRRGIVIGGIEIGGEKPAPPAADDRLPRVDHWSIWNEPNFPTWLGPQWRNNKPKRARDMIAYAPHHYRRLVDAAYGSLAATGHAGDTIMIGETAPRGARNPKSLGNAMAPAEFAREVYCLRRNYRPYTGRAARLRNCPVNSAERRRFRGAHPGLFNIDGWAHHPYSLDRNKWRRPTWKHPLRDNVPIGNLGRLTRTLDRATFYWGSTRDPLNIWITEYGYQTKPPDPIAGVALSRQGPLFAWGEYIAFKNPRVASIAQFQLYDDHPLGGYRNPKDRRRWITWQSGLFDLKRRPKPFVNDFQRPLHVIQRGRVVRLFGIYRPGVNTLTYYAAVQWKDGDKPWRNLRRVAVTNPRAYVSVGTRTPGPGLVRLAWYDPILQAFVGTRPEAIR